jgi:hypothetical protein
MKKLILINLFLFCFTFLSFSQTQNDSIRMKKVLGGYLFYQNDKRLNVSQLIEIMKPNEQAYQKMKSAQSTYVFATFISCAGGFMVGWPMGTAMAGREPEWIMAGIGAGLLAIAVPISLKFNSQVKSAVREFNGGHRTGSVFYNTELKLALTGNGMGLVLRF